MSKAQLLVLWKQILPFPILERIRTQNSTVVIDHSQIQLEKIIELHIISSNAKEN